MIIDQIPISPGVVVPINLKGWFLSEEKYLFVDLEFKYIYHNIIYLHG